jgi:hypothetical protein
VKDALITKLDGGGAAETDEAALQELEVVL